MISTELNHNPYLLLTTVKFNGQAPRINSQIEKYEHHPLKDWVHLVPAIFYNEMNGFDFELLFTGTAPDFEEIKKAFQSAGITENEVRLIHKNEIEDADTKSSEIDELLLWLKEHANRKFDYQIFWDGNLELFEGSYPYIIIGNNVLPKSPEFIGIESVENVSELNNTVLNSTPVVFFINSENAASIRKELTAILQRKDVRQEQLFFLIHPALDTAQAVRTIADLGVSSPQVVNDYFDESIHKYIKNYPMTEYIREAIVVFRKAKDKIAAVLDAENEASMAVNAEIHKKIDSLEAEIAALKTADLYFVQRDNYVAPQGFTKAQRLLEDQIHKWKNRKTKIVGEYEIDRAAAEFDTYIHQIVQQFSAAIQSVFQTTSNAVAEDFHAVYANAGLETDYRPPSLSEAFPGAECPSIRDELLKLKIESLEETKNDFFGLFKKTSESESVPVKVITCYLEQWREKAIALTFPFAEYNISEYSRILENAYNTQANEYHTHLTKLIAMKVSEKEKIALTLSDEEQKLQQDNDWLSAFTDRLTTIERG